MNRLRTWLALALVVLLLSGCAPATTPAPPVPPGDAAPVPSDVPPADVPPVETPVAGPDRPLPPPAAAREVTYTGVAFPDARHGAIVVGQCASLVPCRGFVRTTADGGQTWQEQEIDVGSPGPVSFVDLQHGWITGVAGVPCRGGCAGVLLGTVDGGSTWHELYRDSERFLRSVQFVTTQQGYALFWRQQCPDQTDCSDLRVTTDGGQTWRRLDTGKLTPTDVQFVDSEHGWVAAWGCEGSGQSCRRVVLATTDGGRHWVEQLQTDADADRNGGGVDINFVGSSEGWVRVSPAVGCTHGGCWGDLYHTSDGGATWQKEQAGLWDWTPELQLPPGSPGALHFVSAQVGWISANAGAGPGQGGVGRTTDGGKSWVRLGDDWNLTDLALVGRDEAWAVGLPHTGSRVSLVVHTTDGGKTWATVQTDPTP